MKYINTQQTPVRLWTSKGVVTLDGLCTIELDELVSVPDFIKIEGAEAKVPVTTETTVTVTEETTAAKTTKARRRKPTAEKE